MNCQEVQDRLFELRDGLVDTGLSDHIRNHLSHCSTCQREWEVVQRFANLWDSVASASWANATWPPSERPHLTPSELWTLPRI